jgi:hypothetical protein
VSAAKRTTERNLKGPKVTLNFLTVRFARDFHSDGQVVGRGHYSKVLRDEYEYPEIEVVDQIIVHLQRHFLVSKVFFDPQETDSPVSALARGRLLLAKQLLGYGNHIAAKGDFTITGITLRGAEYDSDTIMLGYREDTATALSKISAIIEDHPNAGYVRNYIRYLITECGLTIAGVLKKIDGLHKRGAISFHEKDGTGYVEAMKSIEPELIRILSDEPYELNARHISNSLSSAHNLLAEIDRSHLPSSDYEPQQVATKLYDSFRTSSQASITDEQIQKALNRFHADSSAGEAFRFGLFLGCQLGMETLQGRPTPAKISNLHEEIAVSVSRYGRRVDVE